MARSPPGTTPSFAPPPPPPPSPHLARPPPQHVRVLVRPATYRVTSAHKTNANDWLSRRPDSASPATLSIEGTGESAEETVFDCELVNGCTVFFSDSPYTDLSLRIERVSMVRSQDFYFGLAFLDDLSGGAVVAINETNVTLSHCIISDHESEVGPAGVVVLGARELTISDCLFTRNRVRNIRPSAAAALQVFQGGTITIRRTNFTHHVSEAAVLSAREGNINFVDFRRLEMLMEDCVVADNSIQTAGTLSLTGDGVVQRPDQGVVTIVRSTWSGNKAELLCAGITSSAFLLVNVHDSDFVSNSVGQRAAALWSLASAVMSVYDSRFFNNSAGLGGGDAWVSSVIYDPFTSNQLGAVLTFERCLFRGSSSQHGTSLGSGGRDLVTFPSDAYNLIVRDSIFERINGSIGAVVAASLDSRVLFSHVQVRDVHITDRQAETVNALPIAVSLESTHGGLFFGSQNAHIDVFHSEIRDCSGARGVVFTLIEFASAVLRNCSVERVTASNAAAVAYLTADTSLTVEDSSFRDVGARPGVASNVFDALNTLRGSGGAIAAYFDASVSLRGSVFEGVSSVAGGVVFVGNGASATVSDCDFRRCSALSGGVVFVAEGELTVNASRFDSNVATLSLGSISVGGGAIWAQRAKVDISHTRFDGNYARSGFGGATVFVSCDTVLDNVTMLNNAALQSGGAVLAQEGTLDILNSHFADNFAAESGGAILTGGDEQLLSLSLTMSLVGTTLENNIVTSGSGGAVGMKKGTSGLVEDCTFRSNVAPDGAGLAVESALDDTTVTRKRVDIVDTLFEGNTVEVVTATLIRAHGVFREALAGSEEDRFFTQLLPFLPDGDNLVFVGGALSFRDLSSSTDGLAPSITDSTSSLRITRSRFIGNRCEGAGGAIFSNSASAAVLHINTTEFRGNSARAGAVLFIQDDDQLASAAADPAALRANSDAVGFMVNDERLGNVLDSNTADNGMAQATPPVELDWVPPLEEQIQAQVPSGFSLVVGDVVPGDERLTDALPQFYLSEFQRTGLFPSYSVRAGLRDVYGQVVKWLPSEYAQLSATVLVKPDDTIQLVGRTEVGVDGEGGVFEFPDFPVLGLPGKYELQVVQVVDSGSAQDEEPLRALAATRTGSFNISECKIGQTLVTSSRLAFAACRRCETGSFNLRGGDNCTACLVDATCQFGILAADADFFLVGLDEEDSESGAALVAARCRPKHCLTGNQCRAHHTGVLCAECDEDYELHQGVCRECDGVRVWAVLVILLCMFVSVLYLVFFAPADLTASILIFYCQIAGLLILETLPDVSLEFVGDATNFFFLGSLFQVDFLPVCVLPTDFYGQFQVVMLVPGLLATLVVAVWVLDVLFTQLRFFLINKQQERVTNELEVMQRKMEEQEQEDGEFDEVYTAHASGAAPASLFDAFCGCCTHPVLIPSSRSGLTLSAEMHRIQRKRRAQEATAMWERTMSGGVGDSSSSDSSGDEEERVSGLQTSSSQVHFAQDEGEQAEEQKKTKKKPKKKTTFAPEQLGAVIEEHIGEEAEEFGGDGYWHRRHGQTPAPREHGDHIVDDEQDDAAPSVRSGESAVDLITAASAAATASAVFSQHKENAAPEAESDDEDGSMVFQSRAARQRNRRIRSAIRWMCCWPCFGLRPPRAVRVFMNRPAHRYRNAFASVWILCTTPLVHAAFAALRCVEATAEDALVSGRSDESWLALDSTVQCNTPKHDRYRMAAYVVLSLVGVLNLGMVGLLYRLWKLPTESLARIVRNNPFFFLAYRTRVPWWAVVLNIRRLLFPLLFATLRSYEANPPDRSFIIACAIGIALLMQVGIRPMARKVDNMMEMVSLIFLTVMGMVVSSSAYGNTDLGANALAGIGFTGLLVLALLRLLWNVTSLLCEGNQPSRRRKRRRSDVDDRLRRTRTNSVSLKMSVTTVPGTPSDSDDELEAGENVVAKAYETGVEMHDRRF